MRKLNALAVAAALVCFAHLASAEEAVSLSDGPRRDSGLIVSVEGGYGSDLMLVGDSGGGLLSGGLLRFAVGYGIVRPYSVTYNLQTMTDATGMLHAHTVDFAFIPRGWGWTCRAGLGLLAITPFDGSPSLLGAAMDAGVGYQFGVTRNLFITVDLPFGLSVPFAMPDGQLVTNYTFGLQVGVNYLG